MTITLKKNIASAAHRGPSSASLPPAAGSMTVKQILAAKTPVRHPTYNASSYPLRVRAG